MAQFKDAFLGAAEGKIVHILTAKNDEAPEVGVVVTLTSGDGYLLTPKVVWFPWSTSRNRLECAVKWLAEARKTTMPVIHADVGLQRFFRHLCRYGVLREIGVEHHYPAPEKTSWAYQGVRLEG